MAKVLSIIVLINLLFLKANASQIEYDGYINIRLEHSLDGSDIYTDRAADNKFYQLKATVISNEYHEEEFKSYVKACMLAESEMTDQLSISLDYTGRIITVSMGVASTSTCEGALVPIDYLKQFVTSVHISEDYTGLLLADKQTSNMGVILVSDLVQSWNLCSLFSSIR
ncbi:hypothetical protein QE152_g5709 [Popillia japonica]|uniref:Uncharacterized protein n=1 Tax=Popillia japonica TaxID=7064 RepID=A0AAW1ML00_POPJA